jgi:hypothetical protein
MPLLYLAYIKDEDGINFYDYSTDSNHTISMPTISMSMGLSLTLIIGKGSRT